MVSWLPKPRWLTGQVPSRTKGSPATFPSKRSEQLEGEEIPSDPPSKRRHELRAGELILYESPEGKGRVEVYHESETFWLSQRQMADLFGVDVRTISEHLANIFSSDGLSDAATIRNFRIVRREGNRSVVREIAYYNLDSGHAVPVAVRATPATSPSRRRQTNPV